MTDMSPPNSPQSHDAARIFESPGDALAWPRVMVRWIIKFRKQLGLPEPDEHWESTAQVRWADPKPPSFLLRVWCLYAGHDMQAVQVRDGYLDRRLDCQRCGWEGPWL